MSAYPLYDLFQTIPAPLSRMAYYTRDADRPWEEVEARRKEDLRQALQRWKEGEHPALVLSAVLDATLGYHSWYSARTILTDPEHVEHEYNHYVDWEKRFNKGPKEPDPKSPEEQRETLLQTYADQLSPASLNPPEHIDALLARIDETSALNAAMQIVGALMENTVRSKHHFGKSKIIGSLMHLRDSETHRNETHPSDQYTQDDFFKILASYNRRETYEEEWVKDEYMFQDEIESRRRRQIIEILEDWKNGLHPLHVLNDIVQIGLSSFKTPYSNLFAEAYVARLGEEEGRKENVKSAESPDDREWSLVQALEKKERLRVEARDELRLMKPEVLAYKGAEADPEFAAQIDDYIEHLKKGEENPLHTIRNIAEAMMLPVDDMPKNKPWRHEKNDPEFREEMTKEERIRYASSEQNLWNHSKLTQIILRLEVKEKEEADHFEENKPMGALTTQSEAQAREELKEIFRRRARGKRKGYRPLPKLVGEMRIDVSGSGAIKPLSSEFDGDCFEEEIYGTTIARITTYSVTFVPKDPKDLMRLYGYVKGAIKQLAQIPPDFHSPFDDEARKFAYERPTMSTERKSRKYKKRGKTAYDYFQEYNFKNCGVNLVEGKIQIDKRLDLDDVWRLYYLLEDIIEPNERVAQEMNNARYAEERGMLETKADMGWQHSYTNRNLRPEEQMGSLADVDAADYVPESIKQTLELYALGEIGEEQLLQRAIEIADHTLQGRMIDAHGVFPSYMRLSYDSSNQSGAVVAYNEALIERTREIIMVMTGALDKDRPLFPALMAKVAEVSRPLRDKLRQQSLEEQIERRDRSFKEAWNGSSLEDALADTRHMTDEDEDGEPPDFALPKLDAGASAQTQRISDAYEALENWKAKEEMRLRDEAKAAGTYKEPDPKEQRGIAARNNLTLRSPDVGHTSNRSWRNTNYVSRSKNSLWVRKDLPSVLAAALKPADARADMRDTLLMIASEHEPN